MKSKNEGLFVDLIKLKSNLEVLNYENGHPLSIKFVYLNRVKRFLSEPG